MKPETVRIFAIFVCMALILALSALYVNGSIDLSELEISAIAVIAIMLAINFVMVYKPKKRPIVTVVTLLLSIAVCIPMVQAITVNEIYTSGNVEIYISSPVIHHSGWWFGILDYQDGYMIIHYTGNAMAYYKQVMEQKARDEELFDIVSGGVTTSMWTAVDPLFGLVSAINWAIYGWQFKQQVAIIVQDCDAANGLKMRWENKGNRNSVYAYNWVTNSWDFVVSGGAPDYRWTENYMRRMGNQYGYDVSVVYRG